MTNARKPKSPVVKWHTSKSPFMFHQAQEEVSSVLQDWNRPDGVTIDGVSVEDIRKAELSASVFAQRKERGDHVFFADTKELIEFFERHLLKKLPEPGKESACAYLMRTAGILKKPISSEASRVIADATHNEWSMLGAASYYNPKTQTRCLISDQGAEVAQVYKTAFVTTNDGFTVQEKLEQKAMMISGLTSDRGGELILPDKDQSYVFSAQVTLGIRFSTVGLDHSRAKISVDSTSVSYGNKEVKTKLDSRNFLRRLIDRVLRKFGLTKKEDLTASKDIEMTVINPLHRK